MRESKQPSSQMDLRLLAIRYRELLELRERVELAEQVNRSCRLSATLRSQKPHS
jgi:hypothetical protein